MTDDKTIKLIAQKLESKNNEEVLFTIKQLRNTGDSKILPFLIELINNTKSENIKKAALNLLSDLKNEKCTLEIVKALKNEKYKNIHKAILTTCWQSGLNYGEHIELFIDFFVKGDFEIAFEAFTIIDNMEEKYEAEILNPHILSLKSNIENFKGNDKEGLFIELIHILERLRL